MEKTETKRIEEKAQNVHEMVKKIQDLEKTGAQIIGSSYMGSEQKMIISYIIKENNVNKR